MQSGRLDEKQNLAVGRWNKPNREVWRVYIFPVRRCTYEKKQRHSQEILAACLLYLLSLDILPHRPPNTQVSAEGVSMGGISTTLAASRRLTLRAGGQEGSMGQKGNPRELKGENVHTGSTAQPEGRGVSTVELSDGGVKVRTLC